MVGMDSVAMEILQILAREEKTGFQIRYALRHTVTGSGDGELYPLLHELEKKHLIRSRMMTVTPTMERKAYRLTSKGRALLPGNQSFPEHPAPEMGDPSQDRGLSMRIIRFRRWCADAIRDIRVSPDREIVSRELYDHMYDLFSHYLARGISPEDAEAMTMETMGSAAVIAPRLGALHRPFWTLALRVTRWSMLVLAIITVYLYGLYFLEVNFFAPPVEPFDPDAGPVVSGKHSLVLQLEPECAAKSDGYSFRVDRADLWTSTDIDSNAERQFLNVQIRCTNPLPWAEDPDFQGWIWAVDSLGNYYYSAQEDSNALEPAVSAAGYQTGTFSHTLDLWLYSYVSQDAEWIEFVYDRSGRDVVFHIDLTGGEDR